MSDLELAAALANPKRSVRTIGLACFEAVNNIGETERENIGELTAKLARHDLEIDAVIIPRVMVALAALFAAKTGSSPKQVFEQLWKDAPTDQWWHDKTRPTTEEEDEPDAT